jgi:alanine racemase
VASLLATEDNALNVARIGASAYGVEAYTETKEPGG